MRFRNFANAVEPYHQQSIQKAKEKVEQVDPVHKEATQAAILDSTRFLNLDLLIFLWMCHIVFVSFNEHIAVL